MKLTKTLALASLIAGSLMAGNALQAQDATNTPPAGAHPRMHGRPNMERIAQNLKLTDDQKSQLKAAMENQMQKIKALRADTSLSKEDLRAKAREIHQATEAKIKAILTPDQLTKWREIMKQRRAQRPAHANPSSN